MTTGRQRERSVLGVVLAALVVVAALMLAPAPPASAAVAVAVARTGVPAAKPGPCAVPGPCVLLSRGETGTVAEGTGAAAVGFLAPFCVFVPPPGSFGCGLAVAASGPALTYMAKLAQRRGQCLAFGYDVLYRQIRPTTAGCYA